MFWQDIPKVSGQRLSLKVAVFIICVSFVKRFAAEMQKTMSSPTIVDIGDAAFL